MGYRDKFTSHESARDYEDREYASSTGSSLLWEVEKRVLDDIVERFLQPLSGTTYLDFACGTGRILQYLAPRMAYSTGIDVSTEMLSIARKKVGSAKLVCKDISEEGEELEGTYDVITAFRFFSNAEDSLRRRTLKALCRRMHSESVLIANSHTNPLSYKILMLPYHEARRAMGQAIHVRYLTLRSLCRSMRRVGLNPVGVYGYGFVPEKVIRMLGSQWAMTLELSLGQRSVLQRLGTNQLVVCRKS